MHLSENRVPQIDGMSSNCLDLGYCIPPHYILTIVGLDSNNFLVSLVKSKCSVAPMQPQLLGATTNSTLGAWTGHQDLTGGFL